MRKILTRRRANPTRGARAAACARIQQKEPPVIVLDESVGPLPVGGQPRARACVAGDCLRRRARPKRSPATSSKGYSAYVLTPAKGAPSVYRVRVGKFKTRREAEAMATRLQKEEQFTPWITR